MRSWEWKGQKLTLPWGSGNLGTLHQKSSGHHPKNNKWKDQSIIFQINKIVAELNKEKDNKIILVLLTQLMM